MQLRTVVRSIVFVENIKNIIIAVKGELTRLLPLITIYFGDI